MSVFWSFMAFGCGSYIRVVGTMSRGMYALCEKKPQCGRENCCSGYAVGAVTTPTGCSAPLCVCERQAMEL
jgi:hypothetical protein